MKIAAKFFDNFFGQEVPSGTVNGTNTLFTLTSTPIYNQAVFVFINGLIQRQGTDYNVSGSNIDFAASSTPAVGSRLYVIYFKR